MKSMRPIIIATVLLLLAVSAGTSQAAPIKITLQADPANPANPTMGDMLHFHSIITNTGNQPVKGLVGWISLVEIDAGHEQPVDLEDWSAHKAITGATLAPGAKLETTWPIRLIQGGDYRVLISTTERDQHRVDASPLLQFHVTRKPVLKSMRILPVALGIPFLIAGFMGYRTWRQTKATKKEHSS